jgi:hypothetical protein
MDSPITATMQARKVAPEASEKVITNTSSTVLT